MLPVSFVRQICCGRVLAARTVSSALNKMTETKTQEQSQFVASELGRSDAELLAACRRGDQTAWNTLVSRFQNLICAIPRNAGLGEHLVGEVFQEVFLALFQKLDEIEQPDRLRAWLVTAAKYKTWRLRSKERFSSSRSEEDEEDESLRIPDEALLPDEALVELEEQHLVRAAVATLDERCQTIIKMLFYAAEPHSYVEIGAAIGVGETSVSPLRARCLKKLSRLLTK